MKASAAYSRPKKARHTKRKETGNALKKNGWRAICNQGEKCYKLETASYVIAIYRQSMRIVATYRANSSSVHFPAGPVGHIANGGVPVEEKAAANEEK